LTPPKYSFWGPRLSKTSRVSIFPILQQGHLGKKNMAYNLITSPQTEEDIDKAVKWYADIRKSLSKDYLV